MGGEIIYKEGVVTLGGEEAPRDLGYPCTLETLQLAFLQLNQDNSNKTVQFKLENFYICLKKITYSNKPLVS